MNNVDWARTFNLIEIKKDEQGKDQRDENGELVEELKYIDEETIKAIRGY